MGEARLLDAYGVPEYFTTHIGEIEDAGDGMVRIVYCIERHGNLIPVFSRVAPAVSVLKLAEDARSFVREMLQKQMALVAAH